MTDLSLPDGWYHSFFHGLQVAFWNDLVPPALTQVEADFLHTQLALSPGAQVLDVPCGNGRHALALANRGMQVTALDLSADFLALAKAEAQKRQLAVHWLQADMETLPVSGRFDGAYCLGNSFGYLPHAGTLRFLQRLHAVLKPGARFVLETGVTAESFMPNLWLERTDTMMGYEVHLLRSYDVYTGRLVVHITLRKDGREQADTYAYYIYMAREVRHMLEQAGFTAVRFHAARERLGGPVADAFGLGSPNLYVVCTRT